MACDRDHTHLVVFAHACGYYSRVATYTNRGAAPIRINTVVVFQSNLNGLIHKWEIIETNIKIFMGVTL